MCRQLIGSIEDMSVEEIKAQFETNGAFMVTSSSTSANDSLIVDAKTFLPTVWILDLGISCLSFHSPNTTVLSKISLTMSPIFRV